MPELNDAQHAAMIKDYLAGDTCEQVANRYGVKKCSAWEFLKRRGLTRPSSQMNRRYALNENAFDFPLTPEAEYWVGWMMSDGYVSPKKDGATTVGTNISAKDIGHVRKFAKFLGTNQPVFAMQPKKYEGSHNSGQQVQFQVRSWRLSENLIRYGVVPRKSMIAVAKNGIAESADFWRGTIDGDGTVYLATQRHATRQACRVPYISLCGASRRLIEQFSDYCRMIAPGCTAYVEHGKSVFNVRVGGRFAILLIRHLYGNGRVSLDRKQLIANDIIARSDADPTWCRPGRFSESEKDLICKAYLRGDRIIDIYKKFNAKQTPIYNVLAQRGISLRGRGHQVKQSDLTIDM